MLNAVVELLGCSSVVLDLRLIGFEAAQGPPRRRRLGDAVAAADALELALPYDLHRHAHFPVVGSLCRAAARGQGSVTQVLCTMTNLNQFLNKKKFREFNKHTMIFTEQIHSFVSRRFDNHNN